MERDVIKTQSVSIATDLVRLRRRLATILFIESNGFSFEPATLPLPAVIVLSCLAPPTF